MIRAPITRWTPVADLPELLRVEEASAWLDCGRGLVYDLIRQGQLAHVKLGRLTRVKREGLAQLKDARGAA
jgi:excisionase family DNA binding protein